MQSVRRGQSLRLAGEHRPEGRHQVEQRDPQGAIRVTGCRARLLTRNPPGEVLASILGPRFEQPGYLLVPYVLEEPFDQGASRIVPRLRVAVGRPWEQHPGLDPDQLSGEENEIRGGVEVDLLQKADVAEELIGEARDRDVPHVELVPLTFQGLAAPLAPGTSKTFALVGNLTVHGVTRPTTWQVTARADGSAVVGTATTAFTFKDFNLDQPKVPIVLSVADTVRLEYDFHLTPDSKP